LKGAPQQIVAEDLRSLREHQPVTQQRIADLGAMGLYAPYLLHRVHGHDPHDRRAGFAGLVQNLLDRGQVDERPDRIVHGHQIGLGVDGGQSILHRLLPAVAALHDALRRVVIPGTLALSDGFPVADDYMPGLLRLSQ